MTARSVNGDPARGEDGDRHGRDGGHRRAIARLFAAEDASVVLVPAARQPGGWPPSSATARSSSPATWPTLDRARAVAAAEASGRPDVLVNNAGLDLSGIGCSRRRIDAAREVFDVNVVGALLLQEAGAPDRRGGRRLDRERHVPDRPGRAPGLGRLRGLEGRSRA